MQHWQNTPLGLDLYQLGMKLNKGNIASSVIYIARDDVRAKIACDLFRFFHPAIDAFMLPAWDCVPYDRVSPNPALTAARLTALSKLYEHQSTENTSSPAIIFTTVNGYSQKLPPLDYWRDNFLELHQGKPFDLDHLKRFLIKQGYHRTTTVREAGEYAIRGSIIDLYPTGSDHPLRLDLFGDEIDTIQPFDPITQRTLNQKDKSAVTTITLMPIMEFILDAPEIERFRQAYRQLFGGNNDTDPVFTAVSDGRRIQGLEHWLPLFYDEMIWLDDYFNAPPLLMLDHDCPPAMQDRIAMVDDHYQARLAVMDAQKPHNPHSSNAQKHQESSHQLVLAGSETELPYKPIPPQSFFLQESAWEQRLKTQHAILVHPHHLPPAGAEIQTQDWQGKLVQDDFFKRLLPENRAPKLALSRLERLQALKTLQKNASCPIIIAAHSFGARERLKILLEEHDITALMMIKDASQITFTPHQIQPIHLVVIELEHGVIAPDLILFGEADILGERLARPTRNRKRGAEFLTEMTALNLGDLVVHIDHGIGKFDGLERIEVGGAPHDCLRLLYHGGDRLFLPVENLELLSRYGSEEAEAQLDRLGSANWQARKAKSKKRILDIADKLLAMAAERALKPGEIVAPPAGLWDNFCAGFGFIETDDQLNAIDDVVNDLASGKPMDRLICGDVGFGKTEIAIRAAFLVAMSGLQVAILAPTTLLARQHFKLFAKRFQETGLNIGQLSRLVPAAEQRKTRALIAEGKLDILIGTHALLAKSLDFDRLGLVIIDEEQHFGVRQKERLKELKANIHFLAMTATPIPRTLQMALSGARDLSIIATPPVDRLAVRSFVTPFDRLVLSEAIRREIARGGQIFYVCPRIADLERLYERIKDTLAPEARLAMAHGQMPPDELESIMAGFIDGKFDILLSTNIVESGLDIPTANTIIIHHADRFGLSQLYQLRGRVGRSKIRAYCYLTIEPRKIISTSAQKRLEVMASLDGLGAGFTLASHDLDIRGAGNLLGEAQSGHIKEIGVELYQQLLEQAVEDARLKATNQPLSDNPHDLNWSPIISLGVAVMLPETYVEELSLRMALYRRLSALTTHDEIEAFAVELGDRFGSLPQMVKALLQVMHIKIDCKIAGIARLDAGVKGLVIGFRNERFSRPDLLVKYIDKLAPHAKLRP
ncbi:MAG: transcription-repair coupling factor, partial [Alphaproteobacteria bacterium]